MIKILKLKWVFMMIAAVCLFFAGQTLFVESAGPVFIDTNTNGVLDAGELSFATIQAAINSASSGDTIKVAAGTYYENVIVNKSVNLRGAQAGTDPRSASAGGSGIRNQVTPTGETVVIPGTRDLTAGNIFTVQANNVTIDGFWIDGTNLGGANPSLTPGTGLTGGSTEEFAINGIYNGNDGTHAYFPITGAVFQNNIVKNFSSLGISFNNNNVSVSHDNLITQNYISNMSGNGWYDGNPSAIALLRDGYASVTKNEVTGSDIGIVTENNFASVSGMSAPAISSNDVSTRLVGIWHNSTSGTAPVFTISENIIRTWDPGVGHAGEWNLGLWFSTIMGTAQVNVSDNTIMPGAYRGIQVIWATAGLTIHGGSVSGARNTGILVYNIAQRIVPDQRALGSWGAAGQPTTVTLDGVNISGSATGVRAWDNGGNKTVTMVINRSSITGGTTGLQVDGVLATMTGHSDTITDNTNGVVNNTSTSINLENNWWGTASPTEIASTIIGPVDFNPWYTDSGMTVLSNVTSGTWVESPSNPIYDPIAIAEKAYFPSVLKMGPNDYRMWYQSNSTPSNATVAYATSIDSQSWTLVTNQVSGLLPNNAGHPHVEFADGKFRIWYWNAATPYGNSAIHYAESTDGITWTNDTSITGNLITSASGQWNSGSYGAVDVIINGCPKNTGTNPFDYKYAMYYDATSGGYEQIALGYSMDGITWTLYGTGPVLPKGPSGSWDSGYTTAGTIIPGNVWEMWYSGGVSASNEGIGYATSTDGLTWTKSATNPFMSKNDGVTWRNNRTYTPSVIKDGTDYKMWFTGKDATAGNYAIGYATLSTPVATNNLQFINPCNGTAGGTVDAPITVNVEARDDNNNLVTSYNGSAILVVSGHATLDSGGTIMFTNGRATTTLYDTVAPETVTISIIASSPALRSSSTQDVFVGVGTLSQFTLTNPGDVVAGTLVEYTATRKDQYGNSITVGTVTPSLLVSPTTTPGTFYSANSTSSEQLTTLQFDNGSATKQFWYYNETVGSYQLTVQDSSAVGNDTIAISPATVAKLVINDRVSTNQGSRLQYTITRKDQFNNLVTTGTLPVYMYVDQTSSSTAFYDVASGGSMNNTVTINDTQSSANVWYFETVAGTYTITVSDGAPLVDGNLGLLDATDMVNVQVATATRFVFASVIPQSLIVGNSSVITIEARDDYGNLDTSYGDLSNPKSVMLVTGVNSAFGTGLTVGTALIDIVGGIGSITVTDNIAETVDLALLDSQGTGLDVGATSAITWNAGPTAEFVLNDPGDIVAKNRIEYTVSRKDQFGNYVTAGSDTIRLYSDSVGEHKAFYTSSTTASTSQFVTITAGATTTQFWYYDEAAGTYTITASDNAIRPDGATGIKDGTDQLIVSATPIVATRYVIIDSQDVAIGQNTIIVIQTQDNAGALDNTQQEDIVLVLSTSTAVTTPAAINKEVTIDIINGIGTVSITDSAIETIGLSLQRIPGSISMLNIASTQDISFLAAAPVFIGGGGGGVYTPPQPVVIFKGRAYPGATVMLFARTAAGDIPIKQDIEVATDGTFNVDFSGALRGLEAFGLSILDADGRVAQTKIYAMNKVTALTAEKNLYIAPTTGLVQSTVTIGNNVGLIGFAAPGSVIKAELDGTLIDEQVKAGANGAYRLLINTKDLAYGAHVVRTKQVDKNGIESEYSPLKVFTVSKILNTRADLNSNGGIDIGDWSIFLTSFGSANSDIRKRADINGDGKVDITDFSIFIRSTISR